MVARKKMKGLRGGNRRRFQIQGQDEKIPGGLKWGQGLSLPLIDSTSPVLLPSGMIESAAKKSGIPLHSRIFIGMAVGVVAGLAVNQTLGGNMFR